MLKKIKIKISYKLFLGITIGGLMGLFSIAFIAYSYITFSRNSREMAKKEAEFTVSQAADRFDEHLNNLQQYYLYVCRQSDMEWFIQNKLNYSDYDKYKKIADSLGNGSLFVNDVKGYSVVNFKNRRVVSSRGIYQLEEMLNKDEFVSLYDRNNENLNRSNWFYCPDGSDVSAMDKAYRLTSRVNGIDLAISLPITSMQTTAFLLVNLSNEEWQKKITDCLGGKEKQIVVLDEGGNVILSTDNRLISACQNAQSDNKKSTQLVNIADGKDFMLAHDSSDIFGWDFYVAYDCNVFDVNSYRLLFILVLMVGFVVVASSLMLRRVLYSPVDRLIHEVSGDNEDMPKRQELDYLAGKFEGLKNEKDHLTALMNQKHTKLEELFELRLIRGEVRNDEEWEEYMTTLNLEKHAVYASAVMVLNLRDEELEQDDVNEDAICLDLVENLPEELANMLWMPLVYNAYTLSCLFGAESEEELTSKIEKFYDKMQEYTSTRCGYQLIVGVSETHGNSRHIARAYHEAVYALTVEDNNQNFDDELVTDSGMRPDCRFYIKNMPLADSQMDVSYSYDIQEALGAMDKEQCYRVIDAFAIMIQDINDWNAVIVHVCSMIDAILMVALKEKMSVSDIGSENIYSIYQAILNAGDTARIRRSLKMLLIDPILEAKRNMLEDTSYQIMSEIEKMLAQSKGNISMTECADKLGVTTTYIWKVLKKERGKTFSEYQEDYKLEEAKKLLIHSDLSMSEIAEQLGYTNSQNFIRFFSKSTGMTPGKYRKLY